MWKTGGIMPEPKEMSRTNVMAIIIALVVGLGLEHWPVQRIKALPGFAIVRVFSQPIQQGVRLGRGHEPRPFQQGHHLLSGFRNYRHHSTLEVEPTVLLPVMAKFSREARVSVS
jgi:hypothetical protein